MSDLDRLLYMIGLSIAAYLLVLGLGYLWTRAVHYPFTPRQSKMWSYYVLCISSFPVLGPLMVAPGLWLLPVRRAIELTVFLLASWMTISYFLVRKTPKPDARITQEREKLG